jgi:hypothetical protein
MGGVSFCVCIAWGPPVRKYVLSKIDGYVVVKHLAANQQIPNV